MSLMTSLKAQRLLIWFLAAFSRRLSSRRVELIASDKDIERETVDAIAALQTYKI